MVSRALRRGFVALLGLMPFASCECDEVYRREPQAVLAYEEERTPTLPHLDVAVGAVEVGTAMSVRLTLANEGEAVLVVSRLALVADAELCASPSGTFSVTTPSPSGGGISLEAGEEMEVKVSFAPLDGAPACAVLVVDSNDFEEPTLKARFTGQGDAAQLCTDRAVIDFGEVLVGDVADDVVQLSSCGTRPLTLTSIAQNGRFPPFERDELSLPLTLDAGEAISLPVRFAPTDSGSFKLANGSAGLLTFETGGSTQAYQVALEGVARPVPSCGLVIVPGQVSFGTVPQGESATQDIVLRNNGDADCSVTDVVVRDDTGPFDAALVDVTTTFTLPPGDVATIRSTFTAPASSGVFHGSLDITSDAPAAPLIEVPLEANVPGDDGCQIAISPPTVSFGVVPLNVLRSQTVVITNVSDEPCFLTGTSLTATSDAGFIDTAPDFGFIFPNGSKELTVSFRSQHPGPANGSLLVETSDDDTPDFLVPLSAVTAAPAICVEPRHLAFGDTSSTMTKSVTISACGAQSVTVTGLPWTTSDAEYAFDPAPGAPFTLAAGEERSITVRYSPVDLDPDFGVITVQSDDDALPEIPVEVTGGPEIVPVEAGRYLYFWQIPSPLGGDVVRVPLQGNVQVEPYWGPRNNKQCAGCHSVSPDGAFVALREGGQMRFIDTATNAELFLVDPFIDPTYLSWKPDVDTDPPYQFVYSDGLDIRKAALFDGDLGVVSGADDDVKLDTMPSWGPNGDIVFVRGDQPAQTENGDNFGIQGPCDVLVVDENGGTSVLLDGASANGMANYYPAHSPDGRWVAFTQSAQAESTIAAADARVLLVKSDNTGTVRTLGTLNGNGGANSYPTWSRDGSYLSFSSNRAGGAGDWDIYLAPMDLLQGTAEAAINLNDFGLGQLNTSGFEHAAEWSP